MISGLAAIHKRANKFGIARSTKLITDILQHGVESRNQSYKANTKITRPKKKKDPEEPPIVARNSQPEFRNIPCNSYPLNGI